MRRVLLIMAGGIAAYKCLELIRRLRDHNLAVRCILTAGGAQFVTPLSVASLSGDKVFTDLFSLTDEAEMGHIRLSREADLVVVAPATADLMAKMANGHADDLASTALLATDKPVLMAPAMNPEMWSHPATQRNVARLEADGIARVGPNPGDMACGEVGEGRMAEPGEILDAILEALAMRTAVAAPHPSAFPDEARPLAGRRALVTSGPTREAIDPVRFIANHSSGKQGHAIAAALAAAGASVRLISGPVQEPDPPGVEVVHIEAAQEMLEAAEAVLPVDIAVCAAAVCDWRPVARHGQKLKKAAGESPPPIELVENPDILRTLARRRDNRPPLVIGFAAETQHLTANARRKLETKGCDWVLANDVSVEEGVFGGVYNSVHLVRAGAEPEAWPRLTKTAVAARLVDRIADHFGAPGVVAA